MIHKNLMHYFSRSVFAITLIATLSACSDQQTERKLYSGYVEGRYLQVAPSQSGWLEELTVKEGDQVQPGQTLLKLDDDQQQILLAQSQAKTGETQALLDDSQKGARAEELAIIESQIKAQKARVKYTLSEKERWLKTAAHDYSSKSARDNAIANYDIAVATLEQLERTLAQAKLAARADQIAARQAAVQQSQLGEQLNRWQLSQREVKALQAGEVDEIYYRPGEYIQAGKPVLSILLSQQKKVRFFVAQSQLSQLKLGNEVTVRYDGSDQPEKAIIDYIAKDAEFTPPVIYSKDVRKKLVFMIEAALPADTRLGVGQPVDVVLQ